MRFPIFAFLGTLRLAYAVDNGDGDNVMTTVVLVTVIGKREEAVPTPLRFLRGRFETRFHGQLFLSVP